MLQALSLHNQGRRHQPKAGWVQRCLATRVATRQEVEVSRAIGVMGMVAISDRLSAAPTQVDEQPGPTSDYEPILLQKAKKLARRHYFCFRKLFQPEQMPVIVGYQIFGTGLDGDGEQRNVRHVSRRLRADLGAARVHIARQKYRREEIQNFDVGQSMPSSHRRQHEDLEAFFQGGQRISVAISSLVKRFDSSNGRRSRRANVVLNEDVRVEDRRRHAFFRRRTSSTAS